MKSLTLDDIFTDYDNIHSHLNISCMKQGNNGINRYSVSFIYLKEDDIMRRKIKRNIIDNLQIKHYIKIGEECPICYEEIFHRKNAFLTDCGHVFHYKCIIDYDYMNIFNKNGVYCPLCREDMGYYDDMKDKYKESNNIFDKLDDFNSNIKLKFPKMCYNFNNYYNDNNKHFHRMNYFNCVNCRL